ncbi:DUF1513 domain-containing protein [Comamonadaceae bacterium OH2545_COT-014]|nr:DUF1513 domain-containing protein [Comamonadaceae bacterium OH2545_COT-014]
MNRPPPPLSRRALLHAASALPWWLASAAQAAPRRASAPLLAATWADTRTGHYHAGLLSLHKKEQTVLQPSAKTPYSTQELPTRAHALLAARDGSLLVVSRRPGDWLLRWQPGRRTPPQWAWAEPDRAFNGHALWSADGRRLFTTETDLASGAGLIGVRDARSLRLLHEWPTHGMDPHELLLDADGSLIVANGGIPTQAETGRAKRDLARMDSSIVRLDAASGALRGQWRLPDTRLSLRHLAWLPARDGGPARLGIALQAEHDEAAARAAAPVLATFDGQRLQAHALPAPPGAAPAALTATPSGPGPASPPVAAALAGYGGSIAAFDGQWWVSCPRAHGVARFSASGQWQGFAPLPQACALAAQTRADGQRHLWIGGHESAARHSGGPQAATASPAPHLQLDNHWTAWPQG